MHGYQWQCNHSTIALLSRPAYPCKQVAAAAAATAAGLTSGGQHLLAAPSALAHGSEVVQRAQARHEAGSPKGSVVGGLRTLVGRSLYCR